MVWIIMSSDYEGGWDIESVHSTEAKAKERIQYMIDKFHFAPSYFQIEEYPLDEHG